MSRLNWYFNERPLTFYLASVLWILVTAALLTVSGAFLALVFAPVILVFWLGVRQEWSEANPDERGSE